jgi:hypothetical protein
MKIPARPLALCLLALAFSALVLGRAQAGGSHYFAPVADPMVKDECGSCHLAFAPSMLPASSWRRMMADLRNHFGDDASLDPAVTTKITEYLVNNAADTGGPALQRQAAARRVGHECAAPHHRTDEMGEGAPQGSGLGVEAQGCALQG